MAEEAPATRGEIQEEGDDGDHSDTINRNNNIYRKGIFDMESGTGGPNIRQSADWRTIMVLAFQCIGVVYGDLGTSPLYVLPGIFPNGIKHNDDILAVLSLIIYSILIIAGVKYVFIVLSANDNGHGGTFALYSLICRYAKVNLIQNQQVEDRHVSNYKLDVPNRRLKRASAVKSVIENSRVFKHVLLFMTMLAVSMLIGDGILTPCISVLSAVGGIKVAASGLTDDTIMWISVVILIFLFQIQRFGTDKVGYTFAPILLLWFVFIGCIGFYNFLKHDPGVIKALNPIYIVHYFGRGKKDAWLSLAGVILCLTGSEALFADLGHFNIRSIQLSSCFVLIPSVLLAYLGQCSYLRKHNEDIALAFHRSIPGPLFWPQFIVAVLAAVVASQSLISASFSVVQQATALGCFPRVKIVHTSEKYDGQVYVPEVNTFLMLACVGVTLGFKNTITIGNAYGIAVAMVFVITSALLILVMVMIWKTHIIFIILYILVVGLLELAFFSSVLSKFVEGGYLPLLFSAIMMSIMFTWNYGYRKKYTYEVRNQVSAERLTEISSDPRIHRLPGVGLFYTHLVQGVSPAFNQYVSTVPALHSVLIFVTIKSLPISTVPAEERFLFQRVKPGEQMFQCVVRYGYKDSRKDQESFGEVLMTRLKELLVQEHEMGGGGGELQKELDLIDSAVLDGGLVYLMGEGEALAAKGSGFAKKMLMDYFYNWLTRCVRQPNEIFLIPRERLLKVGMTYEV